MSDKVKDEEEALAICREKAAQRGLAMSIVDAEYQWQVDLVSVFFDMLIGQGSTQVDILLQGRPKGRFQGFDQREL